MNNPLPKNMLPAPEARDLILGQLRAIDGRERVSVRDALGRVLSEDIIAPYNVPAHDNSAMDGYAFRFADLSPGTETPLTIVGTAFAGQPFDGSLGIGQALRIMTGAPIPTGADTVIAQEAVQADERTVHIPARIRKGQNLRRAGEDLALGGVALPAGKRCGPAELGLIASLGIAEVSVYRRLRVALFSTGDEVASIGNPLGPGQIYDSNRYTLTGALHQLGCDIIDMGVIPDDPLALEAAFRSGAANADVVLTSGGVSVGEADHTRELFEQLGEVSFWQLAIRPGRPMAFGRIDGTLLFGLPGNPVAVMVTFYQFVREALLKLGGVSPLPEPSLFEAITLDDISKRVGRREFVRGYFTWTPEGPRVRTAGRQGAGILKSMSEANCLIVLFEERGNVAAGERVAVQPFDGLL